jgi:hypothetical protein
MASTKMSHVTITLDEAFWNLAATVFGAETFIVYTFLFAQTKPCLQAGLPDGLFSNQKS